MISEGQKAMGAAVDAATLAEDENIQTGVLLFEVVADLFDVGEKEQIFRDEFCKGRPSILQQLNCLLPTLWIASNHGHSKVSFGQL